MGYILLIIAACALVGLIWKARRLVRFAAEMLVAERQGKRYKAETEDASVREFMSEALRRSPDDEKGPITVRDPVEFRVNRYLEICRIVRLPYPRAWQMTISHTPKTGEWWVKTRHRNGGEFARTYSSKEEMAPMLESFVNALWPSGAGEGDTSCESG